MKYRYIKSTKVTFLAFASLFLLGSCSESYLDTTPSSSISEEVVGSTLDGLYIALNGIHRKMISQDLETQALGAEPGFIVAREAHGDDMTWDTQVAHQTNLTWAINTNDNIVYNSGVWKTYYQFILNANKILEKLELNFPNSTEALALHIKGECLAIRGWAHFQLVQYYAKRYDATTQNTQLGVPYRESSEVVNMARNTVEEVYTKINSDLEEASTLLADYEPNDINHYSPTVVYGLRARVALAQQNYPKAAEYAAEAITLAKADGHSVMTQAMLTNGFADITTSTSEALYAAMTLDDQTVYFYSFYAYMSWNFNAGAIRTGIKCISQSTYDLMSPTDLRRQWWDPTGTSAVPTTAYNKRAYQNRKFRARSTANAVGDFAFMRISELYLIAAEAYARSGNTTSAKEYFKTLMDQRDPEYKDSGKTGDAFAEEVMNSRRIELWGEGFRWFDLKRLNLPCKRTGSNFNIAFCGFLEKDQSADGWYYEIPKAETDYNELMVKNY